MIFSYLPIFFASVPMFFHLLHIYPSVIKPGTGKSHVSMEVSICFNVKKSSIYHKSWIFQHAIFDYWRLFPMYFPSKIPKIPKASPRHFRCATVPISCSSCSASTEGRSKRSLGQASSWQTLSHGSSRAALSKTPGDFVELFGIQKAWGSSIYGGYYDIYTYICIHICTYM